MSCLCKECFHLRMKIRVNVKSPLKTLLSPLSKIHGLVLIYCRKGNLLDASAGNRIIYTLKTTETLSPGEVCYDFEGEDNETNDRDTQKRC